MLSPSTGRVRPVFTMVLTLLALPDATPVRADDLNHAMVKFSGQIKKLLDAEGETAVALNQFTAPARLAANASSGIRKALEGELKKREILVKNSARLEVNGDYREAEELSRKHTVVRISGRVVDQNSGRLLGECSADVDNLTSIAGLLGATMDVAQDDLPEDRERAIGAGIRKPTAHVASTRISAGPKSPFAVEILVGPALGGGLRPRPAKVGRGAGLHEHPDQRAVRRKADQRRAIRGGRDPHDRRPQPLRFQRATRNTAT